jgi:bifunctional ADP-heptose synthase (sugar kinase/adenylyltransferase)
MKTEIFKKFWIFWNHEFFLKHQNQIKALCNIHLYTLGILVTKMGRVTISQTRWTNAQSKSLTVSEINSTERGQQKSNSKIWTFLFTSNFNAVFLINFMGYSLYLWTINQFCYLIYISLASCVYWITFVSNIILKVYM